MTEITVSPYIPARHAWEIQNVVSDSAEGVAYARHLSPFARTRGIQPGEAAEVIVDVEGDWKRVDFTAPTEPGTHTVTVLDGSQTESTTFDVVPMEDAETTLVDGADDDQIVGDASGSGANPDGGGDPLPDMENLPANDGTDDTPQTDPVGSGGDDDPLRGVFGAPDSAADEGSLPGLVTGSERSGLVGVGVLGLVALAVAAVLGGEQDA